MPAGKPDSHKPVSDRGVKILSSKPGEQAGVQRFSKYEGGSHESQVESRVVEHDEFDKTKKLIEDPDMKK